MAGKEAANFNLSGRKTPLLGRKKKSARVSGAQEEGEVTVHPPGGNGNPTELGKWRDRKKSQGSHLHLLLCGGRSADT